METTLWIVQVLLAVIFLVTGLTKLTQPRAKMAAGPMRWAADVSDSAVPPHRRRRGARRRSG